MDKLTLYRGIALTESDVETVVNSFKRDGIEHSKSGYWGAFQWITFRKQRDILLKQPCLSIEQTRPLRRIETINCYDMELIGARSGVCFADKTAAHDYAYNRNLSGEKTIPIVIEIEVDINKVAIDGRDFLYTVFQSLDRGCIDSKRNKITVLKDIFGEKIEQYTDKIISGDGSDPVAVCDLAISDNDIVQAHTKNKTLIYGRCRTQFLYALFVETPILPEEIKSIHVNQPLPSFEKPERAIHLSSLMVP